MKLGIDIDNCVRMFVESVCYVYNACYPKSKIKKIKSWELHKYFPIGKEIYNFVFIDYVKEIYFDCASIYPKAKESLIELSKDHEITLLTTQNRESAYWTFKWINHYSLPYDDLIIIANEDLSKTNHKSKADYNLDLWLDDGPHIVQELKDRDKHVVCFDHPWNQGIDVPRVKCFSEFVDYINKIEEDNGCLL